MSDEERRVWSADNQARMVLVGMGYEWVRMEDAGSAAYGTAVYQKGDQRIGQVAFWRYNKYPFYLWGHITKVNQYGNVETREYGKGHIFVPTAILPALEGEVLATRLMELGAARDREIAGVDRKYLYLLDELINGKLPRRP